MFNKLLIRPAISGGVCYLEDHPRTCKWFITMVIVSPLDPFEMAFHSMAYKWG